MRILTDAKIAPLVAEPKGRAPDPERLYPADHRLMVDEQPVLVFLIPSAEALSQAKVALLQYELWGLNLPTVGICHEQESLPAKSVARLTNGIDKQFSSCGPANRQRLQDDLRQLGAKQPVRGARRYASSTR